MKNKNISLIVAFMAITALTIIFTSLSHGNKSENVKKTDNVKGVTIQKAPVVENVYKIIDKVEAKNLIAQKSDLTVIDIRTPEEYASGHIENAINIDFYQDFQAYITTLDKTKPYLIYCRTGGRSAQAMEIFKQSRFKAIYEIQRGYTAWSE